MKPRYTNSYVLLNHLSNKHEIVHFIQNKKGGPQSSFSNNLKIVLTQDALTREIGHLT